MYFVSKQESQSREKTVSRVLNKEKLVARIQCRKPLLSKKNQKVRLDFATEHIPWTEEEWNMVHFSDESKFTFFKSDGKRFVKHKNEERLSPQCIEKTVKFGGGIMLRGTFSSVAVGPIIHFYGNINASIYKELLRHHAFPLLRKAIVETLIFMKDSAPCHKAKTVLGFLEDERIAVMKWPPQSPDMNPIGNLWKIIGEKAQNRNPQNIEGFSKKKNQKVPLQPLLESN